MLILHACFSSQFSIFALILVYFLFIFLLENKRILINKSFLWCSYRPSLAPHIFFLNKKSYSLPTMYTHAYTPYLILTILYFFLRKKAVSLYETTFLSANQQKRDTSVALLHRRIACGRCEERRRFQLDKLFYSVSESLSTPNTTWKVKQSQPRVVNASL